MLVLTVLILGRYKFDLCSQGVLKLKHTFAAYKAKRQYLLTLQVRRYCLLALQGSAEGGDVPVNDTSVM